MNIQILIWALSSLLQKLLNYYFHITIYILSIQPIVIMIELIICTGFVT